MHSLIVRLITVLAFSVGTLTSFAQEVKIDFERESNRTADLIVMLRIEYEGKTPEFGAGIIFSGDKDRVFIATANHVVQKGNTAPKNILVKFKKDSGKQLKATLLKSKAELDLAVISVEGLLKEGLNGCTFPFDRLSMNEDINRGDLVLPVGNPNEVAWAMPVDPDKISEVTASQIVFQSTFISAGHSGGGLLDENGHLVGMTTADQPPFGRAIPMNEIIKQVKEWSYPVRLTIYEQIYPGLTELHHAAMTGNVQELKKRLDLCENPDLVDINYVTPLHLSAAWGQTEAMSMLLKAGADINARNVIGDYPLHSAVEHASSLTMLIKAGANVNVKNDNGESALHFAASGGAAESIVLLVKAGADVNAQDSKKNTPLHNAIQDGKIEAVKVLLKSKANIKIENSDNKNALFTAVEYQQAGMISALITAGADINYSTPRGTALHMAVASYSLPQMINELIKAGANVNEVDEEGKK